MNYRLIAVLSIIYSSISCIKARNNLAGRSRLANDWEDSLKDFKLLIRAVSFGDPIPTHQSNPLQIMALRYQNEETFKNPFELPKGWFGKKKKTGHGKKYRRLSKSKKPRKNKSVQSTMDKNKLESLRAGPISDHQSLEDLALLNFFVQQEEPSFRVAASTGTKSNNEKTLASLLMAEERYNEIIGQQKQTKKFKTKRSKLTLASKNPNGGFGTKSNPKPSSENILKKNKQSKTRFDGQTIKKTLTLSVAFGVIVTALFCVVVQLFKLFAGSKGSRVGGNTFDQINRISNYGYDRIELDVEEEDENAQLI